MSNSFLLVPALRKYAKRNINNIVPEPREVRIIKTEKFWKGIEEKKGADEDDRKVLRIVKMYHLSCGSAVSMNFTDSMCYLLISREQLISNKLISTSVPFLLDCGRSVNNYETFRSRLDIMTRGIFKDVDLKSLHLSITGSAILPCITKTEIEENFRSVYVGNSVDPETDKFVAYTEYFYPSTLSTRGQGVKSIPLTHTINGGKKMIGFVDRTIDDLFAQSDDVGVSLSDIDIAYDGKTKDFESTVQKLYEKILPRAPDALLLKMRSKTNAIRYRIYGESIPRPLEIFASHTSTEVMTNAFHFPCIQTWYDGDLHIHFESLYSWLTGINNTVRCMLSQTKSEEQIYLKYIFRGYSAFMSPAQLIKLHLYMVSTPEWEPVIKTCTNVFEKLTPQSPVFQPGYEYASRYGLKNDIFCSRA